MSDPFFKPVSGFDLPRFAGVPTFMRLPHVAVDNRLIHRTYVRCLWILWINLWITRCLWITLWITCHFWG
ncbi:MAG: hypothetical protein VW712_17220, partial [Paracoccaceae bacterium]